MGLSKPKLSVILPAYNAEKYIKQAIDSILEQTFTDFELIIADDKSTDNTRKIINTYSDPRIILSHNSSNQGKVATVNQLLKAVKGELITIHDADDFSHYRRFQIQINSFENDSGLMMCGTAFHSVDEHSKFLSTTFSPIHYEDIKVRIQETSCFHGPTTIFKTSVVKKVGGLYRIMKMGEDIDFTMRVAEKYPSININLPLYVYRLTPTSLTKTVKYDLLGREIDRGLIYFLAKERKADPNGEDSLMKGKEALVTNKIHEIKKSYNENIHSLIRFRLGYLLSLSMYKNAIISALYFWKKNHYSWPIFKEVIYVLKKSLIGKFDRRNRVEIKNHFYELEENPV